jgi:hypothetical protein
MYPSRKKFKFLVPPSDPELWAIGMINVQWGQLETMVTVFAHGLLQLDKAAKDKFDTTWSFGPRLDMVEAAIRFNVLPPWQPGLTAIFAEVRSCQDERDRIAHGMWGMDEKDPINNPQIKDLKNIAKPHSSFKWKLTFGDLMRVAYRIDDLHGNLADFLAIVAGRPPTFSATETLLRILKQPNQIL